MALGPLGEVPSPLSLLSPRVGVVFSSTDNLPSLISEDGLSLEKEGRPTESESEVVVVQLDSLLVSRLSRGSVSLDTPVKLEDPLRRDGPASEPEWIDEPAVVVVHRELSRRFDGPGSGLLTTDEAVEKDGRGEAAVFDTDWRGEWEVGRRAEGPARGIGAASVPISSKSS